jgi:hypothetical protein
MSSGIEADAGEEFVKKLGKEALFGLFDTFDVIRSHR